MERQPVSETRAFQAMRTASAKALRHEFSWPIASSVRGGQVAGIDREGAWVVQRRQQLPRGFVSSAKDGALVRWETTGGYRVKE